MSQTSTWTVTGMTCQHCVASVSEELHELPAVEDVTVQLDSGEVVVTSAHPLERGEVEAAVTAAGYTLA